MALTDGERRKALGNWKKLVNAVHSPPPSLTQLTADLESTSDEAAKKIINILQVANDIDKEDPVASLILYEHAYLLSQTLDPQSKGRGVLQFKTGLIAHLKQSRAAMQGGRAPARGSPEWSKVLESFYVKYGQDHDSDIQPPRSNDPEDVKMRKIKARRTLRVLQDVLSSYSNWVPPKEDVQLLGESAPYNILPPAGYPKNVHLPEVEAARKVLKVPTRIQVEDQLQEGSIVEAARDVLEVPTKVQIEDIFDALKVAFRFQPDNLKNQREHLLLLLANTQSQTYDKRAVDGNNLSETIRAVCDKIMDNYQNWCAYIREDSVYNRAEDFEKLAFVALYLCIWGEAANVRFLPECICFLFHTFARELKAMLLGGLIKPSECFSQHNRKQSFLEEFIVPIYKVLKEEAKKGKSAKAHSKWRNYDDFNEFFWLQSCFDRLKGWPKEKETSSSFFRVDTKKRRLSKKVSFVEHRTFLHLYHSFVRVWILLLLMLQGLSMVAFTTELNLTTLKLLLSLGPSYFAMKFFESALDVVMMTGVHVISRVDALARIITQLLFYGGCTGGIVFLYWKMLSEEPPSDFYLKLILYVLGSYAALKLIISAFQHTPSVRRQVEKTDKLRIVSSLKWLYKERFYVGRGLYERPREYIRYAGFWIVLLACKFSFSYYFQILPLVEASTTIFSYPVTVEYAWHDFVSRRNHNALALFFLWAPVVLIYLLDIQIWYTIFSAIIGGIIGAKDRLGEIRSLDMLQTRFKSFPTAFIKILQHTKDPITSEKPPQQELQLKSALIYAHFWNDIIHCMREEDYITNNEKDLLIMPSESTYRKIVEWPLFLLASKVSLAMKLVKEDPYEVKQRLLRDEFMASAVKEAYKSVKRLLRDLVSDKRGEEFFINVFKDIKNSIRKDSFISSKEESVSSDFMLSNIEIIHSRVTDLVIQLDKRNLEESSRDYVEVQKQVERALQRIYNAVLQFYKPDHQFSLKDDVPRPDPQQIFKNPKLPTAKQKGSIRRLRLLLTTTESGSSVPKNTEAQRRLEFFTNSLFMRMPLAPSVRAMESFR